jgi:hypothetical protein
LAISSVDGDGMQTEGDPSRAQDDGG